MGKRRCTNGFQRLWSGIERESMRELNETSLERKRPFWAFSVVFTNSFGEAFNAFNAKALGVRMPYFQGFSAFWKYIFRIFLTYFCWLRA